MTTTSTLKKVLLSFMLLLSLSACSRYGEMKSDQVVAVVNQNEIHKLTYGSGSLYDISVYYPIKSNNLPIQEVEVKNTDTFANAQVNQYTITTPLFKYNHVFYLPVKVDSPTHLFDRSHYRTSDGIIGIYVTPNYNIEIYKMSHFFNSDPIYIGLVHPKKEGQSSQNLKSDKILANYNHTEIHELTFDSSNIFAINPYIFLAINDKGDIQPLSSEMMFSQGKSTIIVRANLILLDENSHLLKDNILPKSMTNLR